MNSGESMDEGKAAKPVPKWWSRPLRGQGKRAAAAESTESGPTTDVPSTDVPSGASHSGVPTTGVPTTGVTSDAPTTGPHGTETPAAEAPTSVVPASEAPAVESAPPAEAAATQAPTAPTGSPGLSDARATAQNQVPGARAPEPLHAADPYATPPYGGPGPWAPAPPVQLPSATPPHGVAVPPLTATTPPYGVPTGPRADPWAPRPVPQAAAVPQRGVPQQGAAGQGGALPLPPGEGLAGTGSGAAPPRRGRGSRIAVGAVVLALVAGGAGGLAGAYIERNGSVSDVKLPQAPAERAGEGGDRPKGSIAGIAREALPGVVTLHARGGGAEATGTGFVLDRRGHILTNNHVVESARGEDSVQVTFNSGQTATGEVVGRDGGYDLAVVKVSRVAGLKPLPLGNSESVRVGDPVVAIGAPFDLDGTVTTGIISAKERPVTAGGEEPGSEMSYVDALQTDAPINPGNSGGPLVDERGRVIGINSAIKGAGSGSGPPGGSNGGSIGLGFAIPVNQGRRVAEELINEGRATHPVIGITLDMEYGGDGARVGGPSGGAGAVEPDGPADRAGLREGDVVTRAGEREVHSGEELIVRIRSHRPGDKLELNVRRKGEERSVRVTLGSSTG